MDKDDEKNFALPDGVSALGKKAHEAIMAVLQKYDCARSGGCKVFYSPKEWKARGEQYGLKSQLIVVYDGGDHRRFFNMDEEEYKLWDEMHDALGKVGVYAEECTGWYAAVYES